jgi:hypothetical protein
MAGVEIAKLGRAAAGATIGLRATPEASRLAPAKTLR